MGVKGGGAPRQDTWLHNTSHKGRSLLPQVPTLCAPAEASRELLTLGLCAGVSHGLDLACRHLASPGDHILVEQPTYFLAGSILKQAGLQPVSQHDRHTLQG